MIPRHLKYRYLIIIITIVFFSSGASTARAADFHAPPRDFLFGNHIDTHQETKLKKDKSDNPVSLSGFLYIIFTGEIDVPSGLPIAIHPRGESHNERCGIDPIDCVKGWDIKGVPSAAKFLYHSGVNGNDHPVWMLNREDIPQPGSYTHFHWITTGTNEENPPPVPEVCDVNNASQLETPVPPADDNAVNVECPGWLLEIKARIAFAFEHGGEVIPVLPGIDNATHLNLVTNYAEVENITNTRPVPEE